MKIFVTGASGFIGRNCCSYFTKEGHDVFAIIKSEDNYLLKIGVKYYISDLWKFKNYKGFLNEIDVVIHCAGDASFGNGEKYQKSNFELTKFIIDNTIKFAERLKRFIYVSTIWSCR